MLRALSAQKILDAFHNKFSPPLKPKEPYNIMYKLFLISLLLIISATAEEKLTKVILLPTIHKRHLQSETYNLKKLETIVRELAPDFICTEITPSSLEKYDSGQKAARLSFFPEYTRVILPLRKELNYTVLPCSAWSKNVNFQTIGVKKMTTAHSKNILRYLDTYQGEGKTILVTFGSGHINGIKELLGDREDLELTDYRKKLTSRF